MGKTGLPVSASWMIIPVIPIIAARPLLRSAFSFQVLPRMLVFTNLLRRAVAEPHVVPVGVARPRDALRHHIARFLVRVLLEEVDLAARTLR